jgi:hypothetical protein
MFRNRRQTPRPITEDDGFRIADAQFNRPLKSSPPLRVWDNETDRRIRRVHKILFPLSLVGVIFGFGFVGFICWAIYRVVTK